MDELRMPIEAFRRRKLMQVFIRLQSCRTGARAASSGARQRKVQLKPGVKSGVVPSPAARDGRPRRAVR
ncbi:hypothetical protein, partial [Aromatoleum aromaticum]|uniref:hypothetical protein n=1 Tax=Aromatoleum aromaticum TaxID=551760 RepID=UPI001B7CFF1C